MSVAGFFWRNGKKRKKGPLELSLQKSRFGESQVATFCSAFSLRFAAFCPACSLRVCRLSVQLAHIRFAAFCPACSLRFTACLFACSLRFTAFCSACSLRFTAFVQLAHSGLQLSVQLAHSGLQLLCQLFTQVRNGLVNLNPNVGNVTIGVRAGGCTGLLLLCASGNPVLLKRLSAQRENSVVFFMRSSPTRPSEVILACKKLPLFVPCDYADMCGDTLTGSCPGNYDQENIISHAEDLKRDHGCWTPGSTTWPQ